MANVKATISLPEDLLAKADAYAKDNGMRRSGVIAVAVKQYLQAQEQLPSLTKLMNGLAELVNKAPEMRKDELRAELDELEEAKVKVLGP